MLKLVLLMNGYEVGDLIGKILAGTFILIMFAMVVCDVQIPGTQKALTSNEQFSNHFMDDLRRLAAIVA